MLTNVFHTVDRCHACVLSRKVCVVIRVEGAGVKVTKGFVKVSGVQYFVSLCISYCYGWLDFWNAFGVKRNFSFFYKV